MRNKKEQARLLRQFRRIHRTTGAYLFVVFFVIAASGLLLGWKKNTNGIILPKTEKGVTSNLKKWMSFDSLTTIAFTTLQKNTEENLNLTLQKIDARPENGIVKFIFENHYHGIQLDAATGEVLAITKRRSDLIENIHDGSILDKLFRTNSGILKLIYTSITGLALLTFTVTGFWLWYKPRKFKKEKQKQ